ncbi:NAD(P)H-hydrate dehydratase [Curtobacterium sp. MCPF17_052]|uniref:ADP-dependent NAD(P)H-hydrate dehydratase n=1 Tax=Curtobacterium sp. MCPF17_052 TaxID=2175655 RepID=UPI0024DF93D6|nr:NAD(P)H-hydrate dehydratase [Curtobacterium sp. MCPF17_052]WIB13621.1 NAD(P)H-hydrate dehydratase [Curtobacterium sp. MCPF17_052]
MLSATAALRVGGGRLTLAVAGSVAPHVAVALPESGVQPLAEDEGGHVAVGAIQSLTDDLAAADAVLVGPGLDEPEGSRDLVAGLAAAVGDETVVVLDAFALGVAADLVDELAPLRGRLVMTPNSGEAERLLGRDCSDDHTDAAEIAERFGAVVSLGGIIAAPDGRAWAKGTGAGGAGDQRQRGRALRRDHRAARPRRRRRAGHGLGDAGARRRGGTAWRCRSDRWATWRANCSARSHASWSSSAPEAASTALAGGDDAGTVPSRRSVQAASGSRPESPQKRGDPGASPGT